MNKKILILGGGISGLSIGWKLAENNFDIEIIESNNELGGLASTVKLDEYLLDFGPHFFLSEKKEILDKVNNLFEEDEMNIFRRSAKLYFNGYFLNYPLTAQNVLSQMGAKTAILIASSYLRSKIMERFNNSYNEDGTFEEWAINNFGNQLYKLFFKPYTEQFWKMPCRMLSSHSIPTHTKLTFFKTLKLLFTKDIVKSSLSVVERETTLPLHYPRNGIKELSEKIAQEIRKAGREIHLGWTVNKVEKNEDNTFIVSASKNGEIRNFKGDFVVSTMPLTNFMKMLYPVPPQAVMDSLNNLGFLSLMVLYLVTNKQSILDSSYLYYVNRPYNRISDINKFCTSLSPADENMLALEITCHKKDAIWRYDKNELFEICIKHLERDGVLRRGEVKNIFVVKAPYAYPIYLHNYQVHLNKIMDYINQIGNLEVLGRSGKYSYMDMDYCMLKAFDLAQKLMGGIP